MMYRKFCWMVMLNFFFVSSGIDAADPRAILAAVNQKFKSVKNYQADVVIKTDIPFVKMLPVRARIYFRQPDQFRIKTKGIAILPKQGFDQVLHLLADTAAYDPMYQGTDVLNYIPVHVLNIIPREDTSDLILAKFWIDAGRNLIIRSQLTTRTNGTILAEYFFGDHAGQALPDSLVFTMDTRKFKIPKAISADLNNYNSVKDSPKKPKQGKVFLKISNYQVNQVIPDAVFKEKDQPQE